MSECHVKKIDAMIFFYGRALSGRCGSVWVESFGSNRLAQVLPCLRIDKQAIPGRRCACQRPDFKREAY